MSELKVFELFSGYGSQSLALDGLGIPHTVVGYAEIDENAVKAYKLLHGDEAKNFGDITKIDPKMLPDMDLLTYSPPCQSVSRLGKQEGMKEGSGTESALLWECRKVIAEKLPRYLLLENVRGYVEKDNKPEFDRWCAELAALGYTNYIEVVDAQNYGSAQHRERVFMVSILGKHAPFTMPGSHKERKTIASVLDKEVPKKYDITPHWRRMASADLSRKKSKWNIRLLGYVSGPIGSYDPKKGRTYGGGNAGGIYGVDGVSPTLVAGCGSGGGNIPHVYVDNVPNGRQVFRKLTPTECFRLMGLNEKQIKKLVSSKMCDGVLYKLAGNSIVINSLQAVYQGMFPEYIPTQAA